jgi:hypothetical protein
MSTNFCTTYPFPVDLLQSQLKPITSDIVVAFGGSTKWCGNMPNLDPSNQCFSAVQGLNVDPIDGGVVALVKSAYVGDANAAVSKLNSASNTSYFAVPNATTNSDACTYQSIEQGGVLAAIVPLT